MDAPGSPAPQVPLPDLVALTRKGWALPVLAVLGAGVKPRLYGLARALDGASRAAVLDGVEHLVLLGLAVRNTGHGHPLRPDLYLSPAGKALAPLAARLWEAARDPDLRGLLRKRWSLPLLMVLATDGPAGFSALAGRLAPVTDRALSQALQEAAALGLLRRDVLAERRPPATIYALTEAGQKLGGILAGTVT